MEEISQSNDAMVVNNACCDGLAESKVDKHLTHLLFHVFDDLGRKLREEARILQKVERVVQREGENISLNAQCMKSCAQRRAEKFSKGQG